jgi:uncharacterized membrane protein YbhN (UPF0104 family)
VLAAEVALAVAVVVLVVVYFDNILSREELKTAAFAARAELIVPAGLLYLLAHLCWSTFWVRLLHWEGERVPWGVALRAYYISQFGKYIPGKVAVVVMRVGLLRHHGGQPIVVAVTATFETLTSMSAGALFAVMFLPALGVLPPEIAGRTTALVAVGALPIGLAILSKLAARIVRNRRGPDARPLPAPSVTMLAQGLVHGACGYCLLALALALTVRGLVPDAPPLTPDAYAADLAAVGLAYVAGFVVLVAPGGLGVREFILATFLAKPLTPVLGEQSAHGMGVVVALVLRLTWTISEVLLGLILYAIKPATPSHPPRHDVALEKSDA